MNREQLQEHIGDFDGTLPIEKAWTPPAPWYTTPEVYQLELKSVFTDNWLIAARIDQVDESRRYVCGEIAGERYVVVRGDDGVLRAFYNVCRHHAAAVAEGEGSKRRFVCPYHGWTYGLDGHLINAPELGDVEDFDRDCFGLVPMAVEVWGSLVFVSMAKEPRSLADDLAPLKAELDEMQFESMPFVERREYTMACNWKVYVDNYLDGGYHVAYLHRGLAAQLDLNSYKTRVFDRFSIQSGAGAAPDNNKRRVKAGSDFAERIGDRVLYAWIYPNLMINRYGTIMDTNWVIPVAPNRTKVIFDYYFLSPEKAQTDFVERSIGASDVVQIEDAGICEAVQRGLESRSYKAGRYSPLREGGEYHFHRLLSEELARSVNGGAVSR